MKSAFLFVKNLYSYQSLKKYLILLVWPFCALQQYSEVAYFYIQGTEKYFLIIFIFYFMILTFVWINLVNKVWLIKTLREIPCSIITSISNYINLFIFGKKPIIYFTNCLADYGGIIIIHFIICNIISFLPFMIVVWKL